MVVEIVKTTTKAQQMGLVIVNKTLKLILVKFEINWALRFFLCLMAYNINFGHKNVKEQKIDFLNVYKGPHFSRIIKK